MLCLDRLHHYDSEMINQLTDRIYEAAFIPELWPDVLGSIAAASNSVSGSVLVFDGMDQPPIYQTTECTRDSLHAFTTTERWRQSSRAQLVLTNMISGAYPCFHYLDDQMTAEQIAEDSVSLSLRALGLDAQVTTLIPMLTGELVTFTFERRDGEGRHSDKEIQTLDAIRPHLARSGLIAARLRLERAAATVSALTAIGLPAAVLQNSGRVLASNSLFDEADSPFLSLAFGRVTLPDPGSSQLFRQAVGSSRLSATPLVRSIPVASRGTAQGWVIHVIPLCRSAHDIFSGGDLLVVATAVGGPCPAPAAAILIGLFDLSPAEVKLAIALASGSSITNSARQNGVTVKTARTYLERIFAKTGTHRQSELVALLKSARPLGI